MHQKLERGGPDLAQIAQNCQQLLYLYAHAQDSRQPDVFVSLFTEDAVWERPGHTQPIRGIAGISENIHGLISGRPEKSVFHHIITNFRIDSVTWVTATSECYSLAYSGVISELGELPSIG